MSGLLNDIVNNPEGSRFEVSTVITLAGGAPNEGLPGSPFTMADYEDMNTWPFETMVFPDGSRRGLYHEAYATKQEAVQGHARICKQIRDGLEFAGETVTADRYGIPTLTPEEWRRRSSALADPSTTAEQKGAKQ